MNSSGKTTDFNKPIFGIIGGSGLCSFPELNIISQVEIDTKYGKPSDIVSICEYKGKSVAFLPRHGMNHTIPPHKIPYKANIAALQSLGVENILSTCIAGSLQKNIEPGSIVIPDQFVNLTWGRDNTYEIDQNFLHLPMGDPYCQSLRKELNNLLSETDMSYHAQGTVVVIQGPRFSTKAESRWFTKMQWDIVNMTQYPECYFAQELGICYTCIAAITDYDVGLEENICIDENHIPVVLKIFQQNIEKSKRILLSFIESRYNFSCHCRQKILKAYYEYNNE